MGIVESMLQKDPSLRAKLPDLLANEWLMTETPVMVRNVSV